MASHESKSFGSRRLDEAVHLLEKLLREGRRPRIRDFLFEAGATSAFESLVLRIH